MLEPNFICNMIKKNLEKIIKTKYLEIPYFPLHTQSCERVVKQVTLWFSETEWFYQSKNRAQRCCFKFEIQERFYKTVELMLMVDFS